MTMRAMLILVITSCAHADLYGVSGGTGIVVRVSTADASVVELATTEVPMFELARAPSGAYYGTTYYHFLQLDPETGEYEIVFGFDAAIATGGASVTEDGIAYAGFWGPQPGAGLRVWDIEKRTQLPIVWMPEHFWALAMTFRADGTLIATQPDDSTFYEIDLETGEFSPLGAIDETIGDVWSFAHDAVNGTTYMLAGTDVGPRSLYEVDLFTLEPKLIGELPPAPQIHGIAAIACLADFDGDGSLNVLDFVALQLAWQAGDLAADVNGDGTLDILDFVAFRQIFQEGCP